MIATLRLAVLALLIAASLGGGALWAKGSVRTVNKANPGQPIDVTKHLVKGKVNIVDFYSVYCPPCMRIAPMLEELAAKDPTVAVSKVDINRSGVEGIDWQSPLARQYNLESIPYFRVYDAKGKLIAEGKEARGIIIERLQKAGIQ